MLHRGVVQLLSDTLVRFLLKRQQALLAQPQRGFGLRPLLHDGRQQENGH
jgi:hypothetical protein